MAQLNGDRSNNLNNNRRLSTDSKIEINSLLEAVADCAGALLGDNDFESGINEALKILGASIGADRLGINEHHDDPTGQTLGYVVAKYEWLSSETESQLYHSELSRIPYDGVEDCYYMFVSGRYWGGLLENMPEPFRSGQKKLGVQATYAIPVIVKEKYWGIIGLDFCRTARKLCEAQIAVLKTAATCIGSAIQRERNRQEKEAAERKALLQQQKAKELQKRDRLLNITAQAAKALLNDINLERAIAKALRIVGEGIDTDRVCVMEHHEDTGSSLGFAKTLFEWNSPYAVSQLRHPELQQISYDGIEDWYEQLRQGKAVGGDIEELPEAIRQGQLELGVKSMYAVPIIVEEKYWGVVGFDDCREAKQRTESEILILKATAACIGSAIQQSRISRQREQAERQALVETEKAVQLAKHNLVLEQRDNILAATAEASNILLTGENFNKAINQALQIIGNSIDTDRVTVIENWYNPSKSLTPYWRILYEWNSTYVIPQISHPDVIQGSYEGIEKWYELQSQGQSISCRLEEMPEPFRSGQAKIGVKVLHAVPIFVEGKHWGVVGFDDCREETRRSEAELSLLKTAANCIGGAIKQKRIRLAKEEADRNILLEREQAAIEKAEQLEESNLVLSLRDRWLEATANAANKLLEIADLDEGINAALKVLGESLDCDRLAVMQNFEDSTEKSLGYVKLIQEWDSPGISRQISHPELVQIPFEGIEDWFLTLKAGGWIGGILKELKEPFRTAMAQLNVKSTYAVSIFVKNSYWGAIGVDFCREPRSLTLPEIAVFKTAASCIGSAISRQQIQQQKEEADRNVLLEREKAAVEKASQLTEHNLVLEQRDNEVQRSYRILAATAKASNVLLTGECFNTAVNKALKIIGQTIDVDRVLVIEHWHNTLEPLMPYWRILHEWNSDRVMPQLSQPHLSEGSYAGIEEWYEILGKGQTVSRRLEEIPEPFHSIKAEIDIKILHVIPIFVEGQYWGVLAINNCQEVKYLSEAELNIFKTTANCIGGAIQRERIRLAKEEAERNILLEREQAAIEKAEQLEESNLVLSLRDRWLEATANAANKLLEIADLDEGINAALKVLGESLDCDRVCVGQHFEDDTQKSLGFVRLLYEWDSLYASNQISQPEWIELPWDGIENWLIEQKAGDWVGGVVEELPEPFNSGQKELGVKSLYNVPIFVTGKYWGTLGIDFCQEPRRLTLSEIAVFKTAASCIGSAISRQQIRQAKEEADRNILLEREQAAIEKAEQLRESNLVLSLRDKWLEATANAANKLLEIAKLDESINAALKVLGESLDCDRVDVMQYFKGDTEESPGFMRMLYEWNSAATVSQIDHPQLNEVSNIGMQENFDKVQRGECIGGLIEEFPEPFRSEQIELGVKSIYSVPIFVGNVFWGILGIDHCREAKLLTLPEIAVFKTAASCIGSAISRQQIQQQKDRAELAILEERNRMAREIHDTLAQAFTGISLQLEAAKSSLTTESDVVRERLMQAKNLAKEGITEARRSVRALRPEVLELGLIAALQQLIDKMYSGADIEAGMVIEGEPYNLDSAIEAELFRIAQEAITNSLRSAQASEVCIHLVYETDAIHLKIEDDGIGFDPKLLFNQGFGLLGMQERSDRLNGNLVINSAIGKGTKITVTVEIG